MTEFRAQTAGVGNFEPAPRACLRNYRSALSGERLNGVNMFIAWEAPRSRATRDIDLLGRMPNTVEKFEAMVREVCETKAEPDGIVFNPRSVEGERIKEDADYAGVRVRFLGTLGQARAAMQIDCGFGDVVTPGPKEVDYPTILDMPKPRLNGYPRETVVAEKFEAMVKLGMLNTRMKDFYDIWLLAKQFDFVGEDLCRAVHKTFAHRKTELSTEPVALSSEFSGSSDKQTQWRAFLRRTGLNHAPQDLGEVVSSLREFLLPVAKTAAAGRSPGDWVAPGPWPAGKE